LRITHFRGCGLTEIADIKPWGRWATLGLGVLALLAGQLVGLLALIWWTGQGLLHWVNIADDGVAVTFIVCISTPVEVLLLFVMARRSGASAADYLAFKLPRRRDIVLGIGATLLFIAIADGISVMLSTDVATPFQLNIYQSARHAGWLTLLWLAIVVVTPIGEETLFRGFLFRGWNRSSRDVWFAIVATAFLWATIHVQYNPYVIGQVFVCGLIFGWFRWSSGSTVLTMLLHAVVNCEGMFEPFLALRS
jgi:CAAX protease family protein